MSKNTSVSLGSYFDLFIQDIIAKGRYKNTSEVIRAGLRLLEEEENKAMALKEAIQDGIESGEATNFSAEVHLQDLKSKKHND